jgi:hypothetical protein
MSTRLAIALLLGLLASPVSAADGQRTVKISTSRVLPAIESVKFFQLEDGKRKLIREATKLDELVALPADGPFEVEARPKGGISVLVAGKLIVKPGETHELKLGDLLGTVEVFGDNFPRADRVVVTDERDPGPGEKGHVAIQSASDYRVDMAVPAGFYAVWVVPANGSRAQRIFDRVRVMAGRSVRVGD